MQHESGMYVFLLIFIKIQKLILRIRIWNIDRKIRGIMRNLRKGF